MASDTSEVDWSIGELSGQLESQLRISRPEVRVIINDSCYEHVFSRSWTSKRHLTYIVERPQRLLAVCLGIGLAIETYKSQIECKRSERMESLLKNKCVELVHGPQWASTLYELCQEAQAKLEAGSIEVPEDWPSGDMYLCQNTVPALEGSVGAVFDGIDTLFDKDSPNRVFVATRPPGHHCHAAQASGFCLINNVLIGAQYAAEKYGITHCVILDFDLHHGDGTQDICWNYAETGTEEPETQPEIKQELKQEYEEEEEEQQQKDEDVDEQPKVNEPKLKMAYLSVHDINSYPTEYGYPAGDRLKDASICINGHDRLIWNVHLQSYETQEEFDTIYKTKYSVLVDKARDFVKGSTRPLIIVSSGFDASEYELESMQRHKVSVPTTFYEQITRDVCTIDAAIPVLSVLEGGYSDAALATGVFSHLSGLLDTAKYDSSGNTYASSEKVDPLVATTEGGKGMQALVRTLTTPDCAKLLVKGCKAEWKKSSRRTATESSSLSSKRHVAPWIMETIGQGIETGRGLWPTHAYATKPITLSPGGDRKLRSSRKPT